MKKITTLMTVGSLILAACNPQASSQDQQIAENEKKIKLLQQQAEIQQLQNQVNQNASPVGQVYQLAASEVANTIPQAAQTNAKAGEVVQGTDGQQYTYDPDTGSWLLYGAVGAALGYMAANAMNKNKYAPVTKPTAAVSRVYNDYRAKNPTPPPARNNVAQPTNNTRPAQPAAAPQGNSANSQPAYRQSNQGISNIKRGGFGRRR